MMHTEEKQDGERESVVQGEGAPLEEVPQPKGGEQEAVAGDQKEEEEGKAPTPDQVPGSSSGAERWSGPIDYSSYHAL